MENGRRKAYTAMNFGVSTTDYAKRFADNNTRWCINKWRFKCDRNPRRTADQGGGESLLAEPVPRDTLVWTSRACKRVWTRYWISSNKEVAAPRSGFGCGAAPLPSAR